MKSNKIVCMVLVLVISLASFTACGDSATPATDSAEGTEQATKSTEQVADGGELPKFKIGFSYWSNVDVLGKQFYDNLKAVVEGVGSEFMYLDWPTVDPDGAQEATQNLIEAGCDGIITVALTPAMIEMCDQNGVKLMTFAGGLDAPSIVELIKASENYVGNFLSKDYEAGQTIAESLKNAGCTKIAYVSGPAGQGKQHEDRVRGIEDYIAENTDIELVTNYRGADAVDGIRQILTAYPEIDGVAFTGNDGSGIGAIYADGLQDRVKVAYVDTQQGDDKYIEDGTLVWIGDGQAPLINLAFAMLYNSLTGNPMLTGDERLEPVTGSYVHITNIEEYNDFVKYYLGDEPVYNADDIKQLLVAHNPEATIDDIKQLADTNSIESVKERHGE